VGLAQAFVVTVKAPKYSLLISTYGSDYKNTVIDELTERPICIQVIDVAGLSIVDINNCSVIVILLSSTGTQTPLNGQ
jgi:hypothetical protein